MPKKFSQLTISVLICFVISCSSPIKKPEQQNMQTIKEIAFRKFISHFKTIALPFTISTAEDIQGKYYIIPQNSIDTAFETYSFICYGMLPDTSDFFKLLFLAPADDYIPVLATYDKKGNRISNENIDVGHGGAWPCYTCTEMEIIKKDQTIFSIDSITECKLDSMNNPIPNTTRKYVAYKNGKIYADGKIILTPEIEEDIK